MGFEVTYEDEHRYPGCVEASGRSVEVSGGGWDAGVGDPESLVRATFLTIYGQADGVECSLCVGLSPEQAQSLGESLLALALLKRNMVIEHE